MAQHVWERMCPAPQLPSPGRSSEGSLGCLSVKWVQRELLEGGVWRPWVKTPGRHLASPPQTVVSSMAGAQEHPHQPARTVPESLPCLELWSQSFYLLSTPGCPVPQWAPPRPDSAHSGTPSTSFDLLALPCLVFLSTQTSRSPVCGTDPLTGPPPLSPPCLS